MKYTPSPGDPAGLFATLNFDRQVAAPLSTLWLAWTSPVPRAAWAVPNPSATVEFLEAETRVGGREVSLRKVEGQPDMHCECGWLALRQEARSVNYEVISSAGEAQSVALVTAGFDDLGDRSRIAVTIQLSSLATEVADAYREGFAAGLDNLAGIAQRTMVMEKLIPAPRLMVWRAWMNPDTLPQWWGPEGFSCRTRRIDLREGGEWVFDMIGPDGAVYPNHHRYGGIKPEERIGYTLLWGEDGPKHADAWATFEDVNGFTKVTLGMVFSSEAEFQQAKGFGAVELGLQTLGKLERFVAAPAKG